MLDSKAIANIILHVIFISSFIGIFFFTYAAKVEEQVLKDQVDYLVNDMGSMIKFLPENTRNLAKAYIGTLKTPDMSAQDAQVEESNKKLLKKAITVIAISLLVGLGVVFWMYIKYGFDIKELLINNLIVLVFVAITEFVFLTYVGAKYITADPNFVKKTLIESVAEKLQPSTTH
jgi:ABC-type siderophore export system fused ATPase/permease subunit